MNVHPRSRIVSQAQLDLHQAVADISKKYELTDIELLHIIATLPGSILKYMLRAERHPNDPDAPADLE